MNILYIFRNRIYSRREKRRILNKHHRLEKFKQKIFLAAGLMKTKVLYLLSRWFHSVTFSRCKVLQAFYSTKKDENTKPFPRIRRNAKIPGTVDCLNYMLTSRRNRKFMIILPENRIISNISKLTVPCRGKNWKLENLMRHHSCRIIVTNLNLSLTAREKVWGLGN